jgi:hypothetical protein
LASRAWLALSGIRSFTPGLTRARLFNPFAFARARVVTWNRFAILDSLSPLRTV